LNEPVAAIIRVKESLKMDAGGYFTLLLIFNNLLVIWQISAVDLESIYVCD
jgi:hypothetical protein